MPVWVREAGGRAWVRTVGGAKGWEASARAAYALTQLMRTARVIASIRRNVPIATGPDTSRRA